MATIKFIRPEDTTSQRVADLYTSGSAEAREMRSKVPEAELEHQAVRFYFPGNDDELQMFEVECDPGVRFHAHAHDEDEIIYVLDGEIHFGRQVYPAGSAVYVPADTLYAFAAGPSGLRFLNFRPRRDDSYITKEELSARSRRGHTR